MLRIGNWSGCRKKKMAKEWSCIFIAGPQSRFSGCSTTRGLHCSKGVGIISRAGASAGCCSMLAVLKHSLEVMLWSLVFQFLFHPNVIIKFSTHLLRARLLCCRGRSWLGGAGAVCFKHITWTDGDASLGQQGLARPGQECCETVSVSCCAPQALICLLFLSSHAEHIVQRDRRSDSCDELKLMTPSLLISAAGKSDNWGNTLMCILPQSLSSYSSEKGFCSATMERKIFMYYFKQHAGSKDWSSLLNPEKFCWTQWKMHPKPSDISEWYQNQVLQGYAYRVNCH